MRAVNGGEGPGLRVALLRAHGAVSPTAAPAKRSETFRSNVLCRLTLTHPAHALPVVLGPQERGVVRAVRPQHAVARGGVARRGESPGAGVAAGRAGHPHAGAGGRRQRRGQGLRPHHRRRPRPGQRRPRRKGKRGISEVSRKREQTRRALGQEGRRSGVEFINPGGLATGRAGLLSNFVGS